MLRKRSNTPSAWLMVGAFVIGAPTLFLAPLLVFTPRLIDLKTTACRHFGQTSSILAAAVDTTHGEPVHADGVGSFANAARSYEMASRIRLVPFDLHSALQLVLAAVAPMLPIMSTIFHGHALSRETLFEVVRRLVGG